MFEIAIPSRKGNKKVSEVRAQASPLPQTPNRPALRARTTDRKGILLFSMAAGIIGGLCCCINARHCMKAFEESSMRSLQKRCWAVCSLKHSIMSFSIISLSAQLPQSRFFLPGLAESDLFT